MGGLEEPPAGAKARALIDLLASRENISMGADLKATVYLAEIEKREQKPVEYYASDNDLVAFVLDHGKLSAFRLNGSRLSESVGAYRQARKTTRERPCAWPS